MICFAGHIVLSKFMVDSSIVYMNDFHISLTICVLFSEGHWWRILYPASN